MFEAIPATTFAFALPAGPAFASPPGDCALAMK